MAQIGHGANSESDPKSCIKILSQFSNFAKQMATSVTSLLDYF